MLLMYSCLQDRTHRRLRSMLRDIAYHLPVMMLSHGLEVKGPSHSWTSLEICPRAHCLLLRLNCLAIRLLTFISKAEAGYFKHHDTSRVRSRSTSSFAKSAKHSVGLRSYSTTNGQPRQEVSASQYVGDTNTSIAWIV